MKKVAYQAEIIVNHPEESAPVVMNELADQLEALARFFRIEKGDKNIMPRGVIGIKGRHAGIRISFRNPDEPTIQSVTTEVQK